MIKVRFRGNAGGFEKVVSKEMTIRAFLEDNSIDYSKAAVHLDGVSIKGGLDKTFAEYGIVESCRMLAIDNKDNA